MLITQLHRAKFNPATEAQKKHVQDTIKKLRKEGEKPVTGMFEFTEAQGGWFDFNYRIFPGEPAMKVRIVHGEICTIPVLLAKMLNNCYKKIRMIPEDIDKGKSTFIKTSRTRFIPMDMISPDDVGIRLE